MILTLIGGIALAIGHHLFYNSLAGKPVEGNYSIQDGKWGVSKQQINSGIGTAFAFLIKAFLAVAVSTAYLQVVWRAVKRQETPLATIDTLFSAPGSVMAFLGVSVWFKYPILLFLFAIVT